MVRTRFAPSPTGFLHIGGARTALFSWLYARHHHGQFVLRIEDTDNQRSTDESTQAIIDSMAWLGLNYDEGPFFQSKRIDRYKQIVENLLNSGKAYHCYCTQKEINSMREEQRHNKQKPRYDGRCRERTQPRSNINPVIRFKNPTYGTVIFHDHVYGEIEINNTELDDLILLRSNGMPTYNLTVIVDDMDMNITHVLRGDDHINNTARQINLLKALNAPLPQYAHLPMILDADGKRLSKRTGAASVIDYRDNGYLPEALLNFLLRLGWSHADQEIFSQKEMIAMFDLKNINVSAASLNIEKLNWLNQQYLQSGNIEDLVPLFEKHLLTANYKIENNANTTRVFQAMCSRYKTLTEMANGASFIYQKIIDYDAKQSKRYLTSDKRIIFEYLRDNFSQINIWNEVEIDQVIQSCLQDFNLKLKELGPALRFSLTGGIASPGLAETASLIGKQCCLQRLDKVISIIDTTE